MTFAMRFWVPMFSALLLVYPLDCPAKQRSKGKEAAPTEVSEVLLAGLKIAYLHQPKAGTPAVPYFATPVSDSGLQGALLGIEDDNTTGRFTGQRFELSEVAIGAEDDPMPAFQRLLADGYRHILVELSAESLERVSQAPGAERSLIYDVASLDERLRGSACSKQVLHLLPSRAMRADALAQFLAKKRWLKWFLIVGGKSADRLYAEAIERASQRFGGKIVARKNWEYGFDDRRTPESEIPVFTQGVDYDVLIVADEGGEFGDLLAYRTWLPRPVAGTQGLVPTAWHRTHEAWGALQLQNRFRERAGRWMQEADYGAWLAVRAIGEAAARTRSLEFEPIAAFLRSDQLALAGFKGVPLSFRSWDGQMRQPVLLAHERSLVAVAPVEGFIHPHNALDTLGYDRSESTCPARP